MQEARSMEGLQIVVCAIGVVYGTLLACGLKQQWRWITDPPEWISVIYFPTVVKMIWGPKHVRSFAYVTAYGSLVMSLICLAESFGWFVLRDSITNRYPKPFRSAWRETGLSGSSRLSGLFGLSGSTDKRDQRARQTRARQSQACLHRPGPTLSKRRSLIGTSGFEEGLDAHEIDLAGGAKCQFARPAGFH